MTNFSELHLSSQWRQFDKVTLDLSKSVTILTGENGCGKTTLLNILNRHFGWTLSFVSTPYIGKKKARKLWSDVLRIKRSELKSLKYNARDVALDDSSLINEDDLDEQQDSHKIIGHIRYSDDLVCKLTTNVLVQTQYALGYDGIQNVAGMHIPSHRPVASYSNISTIPTDAKTAAEEYQQFQELLARVYSGNKTENPGKIQKQSLISFAILEREINLLHQILTSRECLKNFRKCLSRYYLPR
jgi:energy-coupling factor transporter ATP-binding protein EcfA2